MTSIFILNSVLVMHPRQKDIAGKVGITPGAVTNIINGRRRPSWRVAKRLAEITGTSPVLWMEGPPEKLRDALYLIEAERITNGAAEI